MQKIYYGAPGTGKSFTIDKLLERKGVPEGNVFRVTFHPEFSYSDFIGQLIPTVVKSGAKKGDITYSFSKGTFTKALEKAYLDLSVDIYLVIEEMSRGNCASIFGDIFQLLDRKTSGVDKGFSLYFVNNALISKDIPSLISDEVRLPPNFHILGTINTSDQNVFVMDTAFKRRFEWEYVSTKPVGTPYLNNPSITLYLDSGSKIIDWVQLYTKINQFISSDKYLGLGEDKQLGQFFIEFDLSKGWAEHKTQIKNKLLHYLWFDVCQASYKSDIKMFDDSISCFSDLYDGFDSDKKVFSDALLALL